MNTFGAEDEFLCTSIEGYFIKLQYYNFTPRSHGKVLPSCLNKEKKKSILYIETVHVSIY